VQFDQEYGIRWLYLNPHGVPCFNSALLAELYEHDRGIALSEGNIRDGNRLHSVQYYVAASKRVNVFNWGGDLGLFLELLGAGNHEALMRYATLCVEIIYLRVINYNSALITLSLVEGEAFGGGFEAVLSSNVIIAEQRARMGLPESRFNLFPGMGAYSLLARRVGTKVAEEMIMTGRIYSASELARMGIVDILVQDGTGELAVNNYVESNQHHRNAIQAILRSSIPILSLTQN
jgi:DSF synthase